MPKNATFVERFWEKVAIAGPDDCWEWQGFRRQNGYGGIVVPNSHRQMYAHRAALMIHLGDDFDASKLVCHHCDNRPCVNPAHLYLGTHKDNARDASVRGRWRNQFGGPR